MSDENKFRRKTTAPAKKVERRETTFVSEEHVTAAKDGRFSTILPAEKAALLRAWLDEQGLGASAGLRWLILQYMKEHEIK